GSFLPGTPVDNDTLARRLAARGIETSDEWIVARTGIRQRYLAEPEVTTSQPATEAARRAPEAAGLQPADIDPPGLATPPPAARRALEAAGLQSADIDLIVLATSTPDWVFPSAACLVQKALGATGCAAFDVQAVCSGFVYAMATADAMIRVGNARNALVIGAETFSRILDWSDRGTCVLFGDGAGAVVLQASPEPGILACRLHADGSHESILRTPGQVCGGSITGHPFLTMDGQAVFKLAVGVLDSVARETVAA